jgi:hypothetical protein
MAKIEAKTIDNPTKFSHNGRCWELVGNGGGKIRIVNVSG